MTFDRHTQCWNCGIFHQRGSLGRASAAYCNKCVEIVVTKRGDDLVAALHFRMAVIGVLRAPGVLK